MSLAHLRITPLVLVALATTLTGQTTVTVPCNLDNTLFQSATGTLSDGKGTGCFAGVTAMGRLRRALVRFNVAASVPAGAKVLAASLTLNCSQTTTFLPLDIAGHRVLQAWGEGNSNSSTMGGGGGAPAQTGDATWLHSSYPTTFWPSAGGNFAPLPSFTMPTGLGLYTSPLSLGMVTDVQFWLDTPAQNFGWLLKTSEALASTARRFDTREKLTGIPPSLSVTYVVPGAVVTWGTGCPVGAGTFGSTFVGSPVGGTTIQLVQSNAPASTIGANFFSLSLNPAGVPLLLPGCKVYLPLAQEIIAGNTFTTDPTGGAASSFGVPAGFPGYLVVTQAIAVESNLLGYVVSNAGVIDLL